MATKPTASLDDIVANMFRDGGWSSSTVDFTYSFPTTRPSGYSALSGEGKTFSTFGLEQRSWTEEAMNFWDDLIVPEFINLGSGGGGELRLMNTKTHNGGTGHAKSPGTNKFGDVWIHSDKASNFDLGYGKFAFGTLVHEIGHALGLQHPGNYDVSDGPSNYEDDALYVQDSLQYTLMSYFGAEETGGAYYGIDAQTPMLHDVWAVQQRYGADMTTRTGNTIYGYGSNADRGVYDFDVNPFPVLTIWDAGGIDEISLSQSNQSARIDLREGRYSDVQGLEHNIAIAFGVLIENARGGKKNDTVIGNDAGNTIRGLAGFDKLHGKEGNDSLIGGGDSDYLYADEGRDTAWGGSGNDRAFGDAGNDDLHGDGGNDSLYGWSGKDTLWGDAGNDYLSGNTGTDTFFGGSGRDTASFLYSDASWLIELDPDDTAPYAAANGGAELLHSIEAVEMGDGNDTVYGSDVTNRLQGEDGNDRLYGYGGKDTLEGGDGNDRLYRSSGDGQLVGGAGIDTIYFGQIGFAISVDLHNQFSSQLIVDRSGTSNDQYGLLKQIEVLVGTIHDDTLKAATAFDNTLDGGSGDDELWARGPSDNDLFGGYGNDKLLSGGGDDTLNGGIGDDTASYELGLAGVSVNLALLGNQAVAGFGVDRLIGIENLIGSDFGDWLHGSSGYNRLYGGEGSDRLFGWHANDTLIGDLGNDTIDGGLGDDFLDGGDGQDVLTPSFGDDFVGGGAGADTVDYAAALGAVSVDLAITTYQAVGATEGDDRILDVESAVGTNGFDDTLLGTSGSNKLYGLGGNDLIDARGGNDVIDGGMGYDTASFQSSAVGVTVNLDNGGLPQNTQAGIDSFISIEALRGSNFGDILIGDVVGNRLYGLGGNDWLSGGEGHDWIDGGLGNDLLFGGPGDDTLVGNSGTDLVSYAFAESGVTVSLNSSGQTTGGAGNDHLLSIENIDGSLFADTLNGNLLGNHINGLVGNDSIQGFSGADTLRGAEGNDTILGGNDSDTLYGGLGQDLLDGGPGGDRFVFSEAAHSTAAAPDVIDGFSAAEGDRIDISAFDANVVGGGANDAFVFIGTAAFSAAGQLRVVVERGGVLASGDINGDGNADFAVRVLDINVLNAGHFFL